MKPTKEYKDSIIRALFNEPRKALKLYSDITGKTFDDNTVIEMKSLDNVILSKQRNDIAFIIDNVLVVLVEHQSTLSLNMPLRALQYILLLYEFYFKLGNALYKEKRIMLPKPEFYMLYNGVTPYPPRGEMRLSESFMGLIDGEIPGLELVVNVININAGVNIELMERNSDLQGYSILIEKIRLYQSRGILLNEAIRQAVDECISENILTEFLTKYKSEVDSMFSLIYDEEMAIQVAREEGMEDGMEKGMEKGLDLSAVIMRAIKENIPDEKIAAQYNVSISKINQLRLFYKSLIA